MSFLSAAFKRWQCLVMLLALPGSLSYLIKSIISSYLILLFQCPLPMVVLLLRRCFWFGRWVLVYALLFELCAIPTMGLPALLNNG